MEAAQLKQLKKGRTPDQCTALDYFFEEKSGCFAKPMPDKEFDDVVTKLLNTLGTQEKALNKVGMDPDDVKEIAPVCFHGYIGGPFDIRSWKVGTDNRLRSTAYEVTWLFFSAEQVFMYNVIFDTVSDSKKERTEEYFYRDITNFSTSTDTVSDIQTITTTTKGGCFRGSKTKETSRQTTKEIAMFSLIVPGDKFTCSMTGNANAESTVQGMKQKLREKKSAMH